jgi:effector-binding domain-containing protein
MRRRPLPILIVFLILVATLFIPFNNRAVVKINAPYFNCYQQLFTPQNWEKWQPAINGTYHTDSSLCKLTKSTNGFKVVIPEQVFIVELQSSTTLSLKKSSLNKTLSYNYTIIPDTSDLVTSLIITYKTNAIKYILSALGKSLLHETDAYDFKRYMENTKSYYGYFIKRDFLEAQKIVVKRKTFLTKDALIEEVKMKEQLYHYIQLNTLKQTAPLMVQYTPQSGDSTQVMMGIPVNKTIKPDNDFLYMEIPATNALIADFSGSYDDKQKIYSALENYVHDRHLHKKIAPLEVFDGALPGNGAEVTTFRIVYPVF